VIIPKALLSHFSKGRVRIRVDKKRGDTTYFTQLENMFSNLPGIISATSNPNSASLLLLTHLSANDISKFANENNLFDMKDNELKKLTHSTIQPKKAKIENDKTSPKTALKRFANRVHDIDIAVQKSTYGMLDLTTIAFGAFAGMGIYQLVRGHIMASGTSLLATAFAMVPLQKVIAERNQSARAPSIVNSATE